MALGGASSAYRRRLQTYVTDLWELFPSFCVCAEDVQQTLPANYKTLLAAMNDTTYRSLAISICKGLTLLVRSNQRALNGSHDSEESPDASSKEDYEDREDEENEESKQVKYYSLKVSHLVIRVSSMRMN